MHILRDLRHITKMSVAAQLVINYVELSLRLTHKGAKKVGDIVSELAKKKK